MIGKTISHYPAFRYPVMRDKILEKIDEGGMGVVYKAQDTKFKRPVIHMSLTWITEFFSTPVGVLYS